MCAWAEAGNRRLCVHPDHTIPRRTHPACVIERGAAAWCLGLPRGQPIPTLPSSTRPKRTAKVDWFVALRPVAVSVTVSSAVQL